MKVLATSLDPATIRRIEARMRPGKESEAGFLSEAERLLDVVRRDDRDLEASGIRHAQIADRLESLIGQADRIDELAARRTLVSEYPDHGDFSRVTDVEGRFRISSRYWKGFQDCPFEDRRGRRCHVVKYGSGDHQVCNLATGETFWFPGLAIHLIRDHHFFEGSVRYRVDPLHAVRVLGLRRDYSYRPIWEKETVWRMTSGEGIQNRERFEAETRELREAANEQLTIEPGVTLYRRGDTCVVVADHTCRVGLEQIDGAAWAMPEIWQGCWIHRREENRYIEARDGGGLTSAAPRPAPRSSHDPEPA